MTVQVELVVPDGEVWSGNARMVIAKTLDGDIGARHLIARHGEAVAEVPVEGHGAFLDIDTPEALAAARQDKRQPERLS